MTVVWALGAVLLVSVVSFAGFFLLFLRAEALKPILGYLTAFAAGTMLAVAFLDLLPESRGRMSLALAGVVVFFALERFLYWYHCLGGHHCDEHAHLGPLMLIGDGIHNFLDGVILAVTFMTDASLGLVTTIAVIAHEVPQELGDFGALLHTGMKPKKALALNFLSALAALAGAGAALAAESWIQNLSDFLLPIAAGGFVFIGSRLLYDLHHERQARRGVLQMASLLAGVGIIALLTLWHH